MLHVVPTPIGNLEDITLRAIRILKEADLVLAEDTRTTKVLFQKHGIETPLRAFHAHNEHGVTQGIVAQLQTGASIALVSDAGTPGISDPGFLLIRACVQGGVQVECLPGATAFVPALVASGLPCDRFHYEGFLPHKKGRQTRLKYLATLPNTFVLYESPHRLLRCIEELMAVCGPERRACVARELSKLHEELHRGSLDELRAYFSDASKVRGEIAIVVAGNE
ncbi:MAG: 16S rRNA (cytidine(1402)-2'-O)-methyltransferase [Saprospiraceae bacterium]|nr:16S rRNA (cytidine(1402)-2'-O)-methyltransferase [Saprospiraceae bacterium]HRD79449.1 16S rRNA (cytidine(1402)-2'-O)-methyltransferase [Saprospiraceae bacterium]HRF40383.1 16S rRNA (cytidine(1402)-2'-O)-methyltransferase [Saprospiraceae bacterium]HRJ13477.1 16S rRNA (cytidine(1402)-2'-O)-methyltransferase [Saprospiraceae bacterium]HRK80120.1 16S rRNA (cytidine(1402)-2'-O)-methyltransferase [Saprospiraceae bacterium]